MTASPPALILAAIATLGQADGPRTIPLDCSYRAEFARLAPAGAPPTFSAAPISRVIDPATKKPYDPSNAGLGCDPADLRRTFRLESPKVLLGEPILVEFRVELAGDGQWKEGWGGNSRGLGRDGSFFFLMRHEDGAWVPDVFEGHEMNSFGGMGGTFAVRRDQPHIDWLAVQQWAAIDRPGAYDLFAFHWGQAGPALGFRRRVEAAIPEDLKGRLRGDDQGRLVDRETGVAPDDVALHRVDHGGEGSPDPSPVWASIPDAVKAKIPGAIRATSFAPFKISIRRGEDRERAAMVGRWTGPPGADLDLMGMGRQDAAGAAMAFARQDDFLPDLERRLREDDRGDSGAVHLGLAMRDDPRAVEILFDSRGSGAIEAMRFLRPPQVAAAIPRLIDILTSQDHATRAAAEEMLRRWTGQEFGHAWEGYDSERPTLPEARPIQMAYRAWWERDGKTFRPRFR